MLGGLHVDGRTKYIEKILCAKKETRFDSWLQKRSRQVLMHVQLSQDVYAAIRTLLDNFAIFLGNFQIQMII